MCYFSRFLRKMRKLLFTKFLFRSWSCVCHDHTVKSMHLSLKCKSSHLRTLSVHCDKQIDFKAFIFISAQKYKVWIPGYFGKGRDKKGRKETIKSIGDSQKEFYSIVWYIWRSKAWTAYVFWFIDEINLLGMNII